MTGSGHPPAGWYPDPGGDGARWWDGYTWTEHTAPVQAGAWPGQEQHDRPPGPSSGDGARWRWEPRSGWQWVPGPGWEGQAAGATWLRPTLDAERRLGAWVRWAVVAFAAASVAAGSVELRDAAALAAYFHWIRQVWHAAQLHLTAPTPPAMPASYLAVAQLAAVVEVGVGITFLAWQHRAASTARWLGLPARHSPGWGVGLWFVPIANLWCPYQALRDCLPPGHPARRRLLGCWLLYLATGLTGIAAFVACGFSRPAGAALLMLLAVLWIGVVVLGRSLVAVIGDAHRAIVGP